MQLTREYRAPFKRGAILAGLDGDDSGNGTDTTADTAETKRACITRSAHRMHITQDIRSGAGSDTDDSMSDALSTDSGDGPDWGGMAEDGPDVAPPVALEAREAGDADPHSAMPLASNEPNIQPLNGTAPSHLDLRGHPQSLFSTPRPRPQRLWTAPTPPVDKSSEACLTYAMATGPTTALSITMTVHPLEGPASLSPVEGVAGVTGPKGAAADRSLRSSAAQGVWRLQHAVAPCHVSYGIGNSRPMDVRDQAPSVPQDKTSMALGPAVLPSAVTSGRHRGPDPAAFVLAAAIQQTVIATETMVGSESKPDMATAMLAAPNAQSGWPPHVHTTHSLFAADHPAMGETAGMTAWGGQPWRRGPVINVAAVAGFAGAAHPVSFPTPPSSIKRAMPGLGGWPPHAGAGCPGPVGMLPRPPVPAG